MLAMELIAFVVLVSLYDNAIVKNNENILVKYHQISKDILYSYNSLIIDYYSNLASDLLSIAKHAFPYYLADNDIENKYYITYQKSFLDNFSNCLSNKQDDNQLQDFLENLDFSLSSDIQIENIIDSEIISTLDYLDSNSQNNKVNNYACYLTSMLKSIFIRNLIQDQKNQIESNFTLLIDDNVFMYPSFNKLSIPYLIKEDIYYQRDINECKTKVTQNCLMIPQETNSKTFYFNEPVYHKGNLYTRGCIEIPSEKKSFACINFNISALVRDVETANETIVNVALISGSKSDDIQVQYYSNKNKNEKASDIFNTIYNNSAFGDFSVFEKSEDKEYSLFNYLFSDIANSDLSKKEISLLVSTYNEIKNTLLESIKNFSLIEKEKLCQENGNFNYSLYSFNITTNIKKKVKDDYYFILSPIVLPYSEFTDSYVFEMEKCNGKILLYSLVVVRAGTNSITNTIYNLLVYKSGRSIFFFIFLTLACTTVFYLFMYYYLSSLLSPINTIKSAFYNQLKRIKESSSSLETSPITKKEKLSKEISLMRNIETKEISKVIEVLNKILLMVNNKDIQYKTKAKLYSTFYTSITTNKALDGGNEKLKKNCEFLIGYYNLKGGNYIKADESIGYLIQKLESEEKGLLKKRSNLEENIFNLPIQLPGGAKYINDFTMHLNFARASKTYVQLKILMQKAYYLQGLSKYYEFIMIKKKIKQNVRKEIEDYKKENNNEKSKEKIKKDIKIRYERGIAKIKLPENILLLDQAINYLTKSLEINITMKINPIKTIFTQILISKCYYEMDEHPTSIKYLKDSLLSFTQQFPSIYDTENIPKDNLPDERLMLIAYSLITENILYCISKISIRQKKKSVATYILSRLLELNLFISDNIQNKICRRLYSLLVSEEQKSTNLVKYEFINKLYLKSLPQRRRRAIGLLINCDMFTKELSEILINQIIFREVKQRFSPNDMFSLIEIKSKRYKEVQLFLRNEFFKERERNTITLPLTTQQGFLLSQNLISHFENEAINDSFDKYIFCFIKPEDFFQPINLKEQTTFIESINKKKIGVYIFYPGQNHTQEVLMKNVIKKCKEGMLINLNNYNVVKMAFENVSRLKPTSLTNYAINNNEELYTGRNK